MAEITTVKKPWGQYQILEKKSHYWIKKLIFISGGRLSLQVHRHRREVWVLVEGKIEATVGSKTFPLSPGQMVEIDSNVKHTITALEKSVVVEIATGHVLETDIERLSDIYGRV